MRNLKGPTISGFISWGGRGGGWGVMVACEQQTHFQSSFLSLRIFGGGEATTGNVLLCAG